MDIALKDLPRSGFPIFMGILLVISVLGIAAYVGSVKLQEATNAEEHTFAVVEQLDLILSTLKDAETGQRGYVLTGDASYLEPYTAAVSGVDEQDAQLRRLTTGQPQSRVHLDRIESLSHEKLAELRESIEAARDHGQAAALTVIRSGRGKALMDELRRELGALRAFETESVAKAMTLTHERSRQSLRNLALWAPATWLGMGVLAVLYVRRPRAAGEIISAAFSVKPEASTLTRLLVAVAVVGTAAAAHIWLEELAAGTLPPFVTFYPAVLLISVIAGSSSGVVATLLSAALADYLFIDPRRSLAVARPADLMGLGIFLFTCIALCMLSERMRQAEWADYRRLRALLNGVKGFAIFMMDPRGVVTTWNAAAENLEGHSAAEIMGKDSAVLFTPEDIAAGAPSRTLDTARRAGEWVGEGWRCRKDGSRFWASVTVTALRDERGKLVAFGQVTADSTRRKEAEDQLSATAQRYRMLVEDQSELISLASADGNLTFINEAYARHFGRDPALFIGTQLYDYLPAADVPLLRGHLEEVIRSGGPATLQNRLVSAGGALRWVEWTNRTITDAVTGAVLIHSVGRDVTDRKAIEAQLIATNERFAMAASAAGLGFWDLDVLTNTLRWDEQMFRLYGRERLGGPQPYDLWAESLHPEDRATSERALLGALGGGPMFDIEFRIVRPTGDIRHIKASSGIKFDSTGRAIHMYGVNFDVTDRRRADEQFRMAIESAPTGMLMTDGGGSIVMVNARIETLFGYERAELIGENLEKLVPERFRSAHPGDRRGYFDAPQSRPMAAGRELFGLRKNGSEVPIEIGLNPVSTSAGSFILSSVVDITERKQALKQLRALNESLEERVRLRTADLKEKEAMLQEIHHRVKNNLQVVASLINMQIRTLEDEASRAALQECRSRVQTMALIHEKLYGSSDYANVPFADYAKDLAATVFSAAGVSSTVVNLNMDMEPLTMPVEQAIPCGLILNELINNAFKHAFTAASGGNLRVGLRRLSDDEVELSVADNGPGIAEGFAPERSASLGMRLVSTLAAQLHGRMAIEKHDGTTVRIIFPMKT